MSVSLIRWLPAAIAPVVVAGAVAVPLVAAAAPALPAKTPQQVLELALKAKDLPGFSGTVQQTSDLGLPSLPSTGDTAGAASALDLLTGSHTLRVWARGDDERRVAVLDETAERDAVVDGDSAWFWDSRKQTAVHVVGDRSSEQGTTRSPDAIAEDLLTHLDASTAVTVDTTQQVAGRDAYTLVLTPKTDATTVGSVRVAVDAATGLPLSVQVLARASSSPAFSAAFTSVSTAVPAASTFTFTPPAGADVTTKKVEHAYSGSYRPLAGARPTVTGEGWASIVEVPADRVPSDLTSNATFQQASTAVAGGRAITSTLVNVLVTTDGRVLAGAVPVSALQAAAG